jgi:hypothetical protein
MIFPVRNEFFSSSSTHLLPFLPGEQLLSHWGLGWKTRQSAFISVTNEPNRNLPWQNSSYPYFNRPTLVVLSHILCLCPKKTFKIPIHYYLPFLIIDMYPFLLKGELWERFFSRDILSKKIIQNSIYSCRIQTFLIGEKKQ